MSRSLLALVLSLSLAGCSFGMQRLKTPYSPKQEPHCSASADAPTVDTVAVPVVVLTGLLLSAVYGGLNCGQEEACSFDPGLAALSVVGGGLYLTSAISGFRARNRCERANTAHDAWLRAGRPNDPAQVDRDREEAEHAECRAWRARLAAATTNDEKLALARNRPETCD